MRYFALLLFVLCLFTITVSADPLRELPYVSGQVIVRFDQPTSLEQAKTLLDPSRFSVDKVLVKQLDLYLVKLAPGLDVPTALNMLKGFPQLRYAQADHILHSRTTFPNDTQFSSQWSLNNPNDADVDAPEAWDVTTGGLDAGGDDIVIAIVDGGAQTNHQDLLANRWVNPNEIPGNGIDDDNNGYVDDIYGWNAYNNNGTIPVDNHGTHVAGIAAARGNNGQQVCGINWQAKLMYVAASSSQTSVISIGYGYVLTMKQLWWSSGGTRGANVVVTNSSFGVDLADCQSGTYPVWNDLYNSMGQQGILSACATANANYNIDTQGDVPTGCSSPYIISVTNTTNTDQKNTSAAYGATTIDLGAPGTNILSTYPTNSTSNLTGTSMATPHVAGAVALMHAAASADFYSDYTAHPDSLARVLKQILLANVDTIPALRNITVSGGRLNLFRAVTAIHAYVGSSPTQPHLVFENLSVNDTVGGNGNGRVDRGETANLIVTLTNIGALATGVTATISTSDPYITVTDSVGSYGNLANGDTQNNSLNPFVISADPATPLEEVAQFTLTIHSLEPYTVVRTFDLTIGLRTIYWADSVESGVDGWTHGNVLPSFGDQWHISSEMYSSPSNSWKCGDTGTGNYANLLDAGLVTPAVTITPQSTLHFHHWMSSEISSLYPDSAYDGGIVEISSNNGPFVQVTPLSGYPKTFRYLRGGGGNYTGPLPGASCFAGTIPWSEGKLDLSAYTGQTIRVRFRFCSDSSTALEGWYVDDLLIAGQAPAVTPGDPSELVVRVFGADIQLDWTGPVGGASYYVIYRDTLSTFSPTSADSIGTSLAPNFLDTGAVNSNARSYYVVKAVNQ